MNNLLRVLFDALQLAVLGVILVIGVICIVGMVLGFLGIGFCDIEFDDEDDRGRDK